MKFKQSGKLTSLIAETTSSDDAGLIEKIIELDYFELFKHRKIHLNCHTVFHVVGDHVLTHPDPEVED